ncbi:unnamed protein product [Paramecium sonneborni]|uniref:Uncharacterized protein n=1 Tax=Paramecium sonneborni TaxID=65129 RepID=A0A8S1MQE7_9CILI|nr:unnamed protein product [Paramecium sonneborni]
MEPKKKPQFLKLTTQNQQKMVKSRQKLEFFLEQ